jgi:hypothetical protein
MVDLGVIDGKRRRKAIYGKRQRDVIDRLNEALRDRQRGFLPKPGKVTVEQWLANWLRTVAPSVRPRGPRSVGRPDCQGTSAHLGVARDAR